MFKRRFVLPAIVAAGVALGGLAVAGPAKADTCPAGSSCQSATVHVLVGITFAFTGGASFNLSPNVTSPSAVRFNVQTNNPHGYSISLSGTDPTTVGGSNFPASQLSYDTLSGGADVGTPGGTVSLSNTVARFFNSTQPTAGTDFAQDWTANVSANQAPGDYLSTLSYVASVNP